MGQEKEVRNREGNGNNKQAYRSVAEVLDEKWIGEGMSPEELEQNRRLADIFDRLLAAGQTADDINAEWEKKTSQEILCEYEGLFVSKDKNVTDNKIGASPVTK